MSKPSEHQSTAALTQQLKAQQGQACHHTCAVTWCPNSGRNSLVSFFRFPKDDRCEAWVKFAQREDLLKLPRKKIYERYRVCSDHFTDDDFMNDEKRRLTWKAVPSKGVPDKLACLASKNCNVSGETRTTFEQEFPRSTDDAERHDIYYDTYVPEPLEISQNAQETFLLGVTCGPETDDEAVDSEVADNSHIDSKVTDNDGRPDNVIVDNDSHLVAIEVEVYDSCPDNEVADNGICSAMGDYDSYLVDNEVASDNSCLGNDVADDDSCDAVEDDDSYLVDNEVASCNSCLGNDVADDDSCNALGDYDSYLVGSEVASDDSNSDDRLVIDSEDCWLSSNSSSLGAPEEAGYSPVCQKKAVVLRTIGLQTDEHDFGMSAFSTFLCLLTPEGATTQVTHADPHIALVPTVLVEGSRKFHLKYAVYS